MEKTEQMSLYQKHQKTLQEATAALANRNYYTPYPEHPKVYAEDADEKGKASFLAQMNQDFTALNVDTNEFVGEEVSPYLQTGIGVKYPSLAIDEYVKRSQTAFQEWRKVSLEDRAGLLIETLDRVTARFFEIAYATMHTTGQSFIMSFQASGPHSNDRSLEAIAMGYQELKRFPNETTWSKPMGKFDLNIKKDWSAVAKGVGLVIGCSTFPTWNTTPGIYADLITGNSVIVKPHPKAILPIAIVIAEIRNVLKENGFNADIVQLAPDTLANPITKMLAEHDSVKLIDYTGSSHFGEYIETLPKTVFTEKAGVNSVILDSADDLKGTLQNIAFSVSLYSGQMCTAPQNIFIPQNGVNTPEGLIPFEDVVTGLAAAIKNIAEHPKMGAGTLGGIQNDQTLAKITKGGDFGGRLVLDNLNVVSEEFENARVVSPKLVILDASKIDTYSNECFGPMVFAIKTANTDDSISLAADLAEKKGAITCLAFTNDNAVQNKIAEEMNNRFTPVSFNFGGAAFVNSHAAFSDFHVTGGNPAGNASFTNPDYVNRRFVWVGNRYMA
jgi:phenylacetic acid degradation protein paaN